MEHSFRFPSNKLIRFPSDNHPETVLDVHVKQGMELEELKQIMLNSESFVLDESKIINEFFKPPQSFQESKWKQASEILAHRYLAYRKTLGSETSGEPEGNEFKLLKLALVNPRAIEHVAQFQQELSMGYYERCKSLFTAIDQAYSRYKKLSNSDSQSLAETFSHFSSITKRLTDIDNELQKKLSDYIDEYKSHPEEPPESVTQKHCKELMAMGFTQSQAIGALQSSNNDLNGAVSYLLGDDSTASPERRQDTGTISTVSSSSSNPNNNWWSTNENFKRLGGWLEKAKSKFDSAAAGASLDGNHKRDIQIPSETFSVNIGTQVRHMATMRLVLSPISASLGLDADASVGEEARRVLYSQSLQNLCSNSLSATAVVVCAEDLPFYKYGITGNKELFQYCREYAELHFESLLDQITLCEKALFDADLNQVCVKEGDVLVTRHSNIVDTHVVFHLIISRRALSDSAELGQRSACIAGLKNIFELCSRYDVKNLRLPLLLVPDDYYFDNSSTQIIASRAETVLKTIKACLMEQYRFNSGLSAIQLFLHPHSDWDKTKGLLRSIYRTV